MSETHPDTPPPEQSSPEGSPRPLLPIGTRLALYYILIFTILSLGMTVGILLFGGPELLAAATAGEAEIDFVLMLGIRAALAPLVVVTTIGFVRFIDRKPITAIGAGWPGARDGGRVREALGVLAGAAGVLALWWTLALVVLDFHLDAAGAADPAAGPHGASVFELGLLGLGLLATACLEEWIFRGYLYSTLRERLSWVNTTGITALLFVFLPALTTGMTAAALVNTFLLGFALGTLRELRGTLWLPAIFHGSWNFLLGCVFSLPVSGVGMPRLFEVTISGADAWSGGEYGPEASWLLTPLLAVAIALVAKAIERGDQAAAAGEDAAPG